jgi:hypothetical protein
MIILLKLVEAVASIRRALCIVPIIALCSIRVFRSSRGLNCRSCDASCNGERRQLAVSCCWRRSRNGSFDTTMCQTFLLRSEVPYSDFDMQGLVSKIYQAMRVEKIMLCSVERSSARVDLHQVEKARVLGAGKEPLSVGPRCRSFPRFSIRVKRPPKSDLFCTRSGTPPTGGGREP